MAGISTSPPLILTAQPYDARLAAAGSRRAELFALLAAAPPDTPLPALRRLVVEENVAGKGSAVSREKVWRQLRERYVLDRSLPVFAAFMDAITASTGEGDRGLLAYLLFASANRLFREASMECVVPSLGRAGTPIPTASVQESLRALLRRERLSWSPETVEKVGQNLLSALRDFGLLGGGTRKVSVIPRPGPAVTWYAAALAHLEGMTARQVPSSVWFALLACDATRADALLRAASEAGVLSYRSQADVVELSLRPLARMESRR